MGRAKSNQNVTDINRKKEAEGVTEEESEEEEEPKPQISSGQIEVFLLRYLENNDPSYLPYGCDPSLRHEKFNAWTYWTDLESEPRLVELDEKNGLAKSIGVSRLIGNLQEHLSKFSDPEYPSGRYCLSNSQCKGLAHRFLAGGRKLNTWPQTVGFKSSSGYFFRRHNFDPAEKATKADFPTINLNLDYMTNSRSFCERVGSLYDPEADRKQILFLIGEGDGGKSALLDLLTFLAGGPKGVAPVDLSVFSQFGMKPLLDKRVWIGEELSPKFFQGDKWKTLTGGSAVSINPKGKDIFNAYLSGMLFCAANKRPILKEDSGMRNRLIFCTLETIPREKRLLLSETKRRMRLELPYFIRYCMDLYSETGNRGSLTPDNTDEIENIIANNEMDISAIFDQYCELDLTKLGKNASVSTKDWKSLWVTICEDNKGIIDKTSRQAFNDYAAKRLGRKDHAISCSGKSGRWVSGLTIRKEVTF